MPPELVRVVFDLNPMDWHGNATERLWAEPLGGGRFRLRNSPFFAFGVSFEDIVFGEERADGQIHYCGTSIHAGHSTYRLIPRGSGLDAPLFREHWSCLEKLGCTFESGRVLAVDVPPSADISETYKCLEAGLSAGAWDFEEGHVGHPLAV